MSLMWRTDSYITRRNADQEVQLSVCPFMNASASMRLRHRICLTRICLPMKLDHKKCKEKNDFKFLPQCEY